MRKRYSLTVLILLVVTLFLSACEVEPEVVTETVVEEVEVTRIVEGETIVETITQEVEVTRIVELEPESEGGETAESLPETPPGEYENAGRHETVIFDMATVHADPANWNPFGLDALRDVGLQQAMIEPLFILNYDTGEIDPWLGVSMEPNETFDVWILTLREGITWSDGEPFNADDVIFTVEMFLANAPDVGADVARWTDSVERIDDLTVQFNLVEPNPRYLLDNWSVKIWGDRNTIVPEHIWRDHMDAPLEFTNYDADQGWPVFTGPYLVAGFTESEITYIRDDNWWGAAAGFEDLPAPKRLIWGAYGSEDTRAAAAIDNDLDALNNTTLGTFEAIIAQNPNFTTWVENPPYAWQDPCPRYLSINTQHPNWSSPAMRQAVNLALDRDQIVTIAYEGASYPSQSLFVEYGAMDTYISALSEAGLTASATADTDAAKALIEGEGWTLNDQGWYEKDGDVLTMELLVFEESIELRRIADVVAEQLRRLGIDSQPRILTFLSWLTELGAENEDPANDYEGAINFLCGGVNEPYATLNTFHGGADATQGGLERWSGENWEAYRVIVEQLEQLAVNDPAGIPLVVDAYELLLADMPAITLTQATALIPLNTTYWTGWPTASNPYTYPSTWTQNTHLTLHNLQPAQ